MSVDTDGAEGRDTWSESEREDPGARSSRHASRFASASGARSPADHPLMTKLDILGAQRAAPPFGGMLACDPQQVARMYVGAGPEVTFFTERDLVRLADHGAWAFWTNGFRASDVVDVTISYHWVSAGTLMDESFRRLGCAVLPGGVGGTTQHLDNIRLCGVTGLFAFPTFLDELTRRGEEAGVDLASLGVRRAAIAGEIQTEGRRSYIEDRWDLQVREMYGCAEVPFIAAECDFADGMHLNPELMVEVLDPETWRSVSPGSPGVVVVSDPYREAMPILRYVTGDITQGVNEEPCPCGRTTPRMGRIIGRTGGIPRVKGLFVVPAQVQRALDTLERLGPWQLIIDRPGTQDTLELVSEDTGPEATREALGQRTVEVLREAIHLTATVTLVPQGSISTDAETVIDRRGASAVEQGSGGGRS